jgi:ABC-type amino acid transport substrate-binding protein
MVWLMEKGLKLAVAAVLAAVLAAGLTGCGIQMPADPDGTLDRVEGGALRVGATENPPWVELGDGPGPAGTEPALIEAFAAQHDAEVEWTTGSEAELLDALERGTLDVVVGGFLDDTPWVDKGATTFPYTASAGGEDKHVMIVRMGENRLLVELEEFLHEEAS